MFSQYFGNYLLNKNLVTTEELKEALEYQKSIHVKLGILAINLGYMNSTQVQEVHQQQMKIDKRFGEIAIQLGYLNEHQLQNLLSTQKQGYLQLSQALVDKKFLTLDQLQNELENYKKDCQLTAEQIEILKQGDIDKIVHVFLDFEDSFRSKIYSDYTALILKNVIRLLDETPRLEKKSPLNNYTPEWLVCQKIYGEYNLFTGIAADKNMFLTLASKFAGEKFNCIDEMTKASVTEFLNVHNGIFLVNMSNQNIELQMEPQKLYQQAKIENDDDTYIIPIHLIDGKFDLIISSTEFPTA
ncbi:MAG: hypothetical protein ACOX2N_08955 [Peptococcia bacterium]|jgi:hypothetical protein